MQTNFGGLTVSLILIVCETGEGAKPISCGACKVLILRTNGRGGGLVEGFSGVGRPIGKPILGGNKAKQSQFMA
jgi:hypothetical protein